MVRTSIPMLPLGVGGGQVESDAKKKKNYSTFGRVLRVRLKLTDFAINGVEVRGIRHVDFSHNNLVMIPSSVGALVYLEELVVQHNMLHSVSGAIGNCKRLRKVLLDYNALERLPAELHLCKDLKTLTVSHNRLREIPQFLPSCKSLHTVDLSHNDIHKNKFVEGRQWVMKLEGNPLDATPAPSTTTSGAAVTLLSVRLGYSESSIDKAGGGVSGRDMSAESGQAKSDTSLKEDSITSRLHTARRAKDGLGTPLVRPPATATALASSASHGHLRDLLWGSPGTANLPHGRSMGRVGVGGGPKQRKRLAYFTGSSAEVLQVTEDELKSASGSTAAYRKQSDAGMSGEEERKERIRAMHAGAKKRGQSWVSHFTPTPFGTVGKEFAQQELLVSMQSVCLHAYAYVCQCVSVRA